MVDVYERLRQKLDAMTKGYPKTEKGSEMVFLKKVFTEEDAEFFIQFKPGLQSPDQVAYDFGLSVDDAERRMESMSKKGLMYWEQEGQGKKYRIIPFIHGIWEFNVDRFEEEDAKNMGQYYADGYAKVLMDYHLPISRVVPIRPDTVKDGKLLPDDDIEKTIKKQKLIIATDCACRKVARFSRKPCACTEDANVCVAFGQTAEYLLQSQIGNPRLLTVEETLEMLRNNEKKGLFLQAAHAKDCSGFCSCSKCHCGFLMAAKIHRGSAFATWSNYKCEKNDSLCIDCGKCAERCPLKAMWIDEWEKSKYSAEKCLGCGLCVTICVQGALILERKPDSQITLPQDEKFFDNQERMGREKAEIDKARMETRQAEAK